MNTRNTRDINGKQLALAVALQTAIVGGFIKYHSNNKKYVFKNEEKTETISHALPDSLKPDTLYLENFFLDYDAKLIRYKSISGTGRTDLALGVYNGKEFYSGDRDVILATDFGNDNTIDYWTHYSKKGNLLDYKNPRKLSDLEEKMLSEENLSP